MVHKVTIDNLEESKKLFLYHGLSKVMFEVGERVEFFVFTATDTSYSVTAAQVPIHCDVAEIGGKSKYSFIMPDEDVAVTVSSRNDMMNHNYEQPMMNMTRTIGTMGMMGMMEMVNSTGGMGMNASVPTSQSLKQDANELDPYPWEGKPKFCRVCGSSTKGANKFCSNCGKSLVK